jgi:hypothetical protein
MDKAEPRRSTLEGIKELKEGDKSPKYKFVTRQPHEAIGIKLDQVNKHIHRTDLGGTVYQCGL